MVIKCNKKAIFLIASMLIFLLVGVVSAAEETNETVDNVAMEDNALGIAGVSQNDGGELNSQYVSVDQSNILNQQNRGEIKTSSGNEKNFNDLQTTIDNLQDNNVLDLDCDYKYTGTGNFSGITITKNNFTIDGHGHTLDANAGNNSVRIFNVTGNNVVLKNLILINANITGGGAAIYNTGKLVSVNNTTFINNTANSDGSAINNCGDDFTVSNSTFINNSATIDGAIENYYAVNFKVINSTFINNKASYGGAIRNYRGANSIIYGSTFINNTAKSEGGAICNSGVNFTVVNSTFINDTSNYEGGAIQNHGANFTVINSKFTNNKASYEGGAIRNGEGDFTVVNSTFTDNTADSDGGAIYNNQGIGFNVVNSTFINGGARYGGAIYNYGAANITVVNSTFTGCGADDSGAAIYNKNAVGVTVSNSTFISCRANFGAAIYNYGNNFTVTNSTFIKNTAGFSGGAIYNGGVDCLVDASIFINNKASGNLGGYGGAIYNFSDGDKLVVSNSTFTGNTAASAGTAIYHAGSYFVTTSITVNGNWWGTNSPDWGNLLAGDIVHDTFAVLNLTNTGTTIEVYFYRNGTTEVLPIYRDVNITIGNKLFTGKIINGVFKMNYTLPTQGYVITASVDNQKLFVNFNSSFSVLQNKINSCPDNSVLDLDRDYMYDGIGNFTGITITKNNFTIDGHGHTLDANAGSNSVRIFNITGTNVTLKNLILINANVTDKGAAIYNSGKSLTLNNTTFTNNIVSKYGGAIYNDKSDGFIVVNSTFTGNWATVGAAVYNDKGPGFIVCGSTFTNNSASNSASAIFNTGVGFTVDNSNFFNNKGHFYGAIRNDAEDFTVVNSIFTNNSALDCSAIYNGGVGFNLVNSTFTYNAAVNDGGAIENNGGNFTVCNSTFTYNTAGNDGGAIYSRGLAFGVSNSTFVGNTAGNGGDAIYSTKSSVDNDNWWGNNTPDWSKLINNNVVLDTFAVLNLTNVVNTIEVYFYRNGTTEVLPISRNFNLTINGQQSECKIINGHFSYQVPFGSYNVTIDVDNQKLNMMFNFSSVDNIYVDSVNGYDNNTGTDWSDAVKTIEYAIKRVSNNGTIYISDGIHIVSDRLDITNPITIIGNSSKTVITNNRNNNGVFEIISDNVTIYNCTFVNNTVWSNGSVIYIFGGRNFTVVGCIFANNSANSGGIIWNDGAANLAVVACIFVNNLVSKDGGAIFNYGPNCTIKDSMFTNNSASNAGGAIFNHGISCTVVNTTFINNSAIKGVIYNIGTITLNNNGYSGIIGNKTYIYNEGIILSPVTITVLGNQTINTQYGQNVTLFANIITNDGASVVGGSLNFTINSNNYNATSYDDGNYSYKYTVGFNGKQLVDATYGGANNLTVKTGILNVDKISADVNISVENIFYGENATITVCVTPNATGNVTITVNNENKTVNLTNSKATLNITNLNPGTYKVIVTYNGDDTHANATANITFTVYKTSKYDMNISVSENVYVGENVTISVNLPKDAKGSVVISIDNLNYSVNIAGGVASIVLNNLTAGVHNINATYGGDDKYNPMSKDGNITLIPKSVILDVNDVVMTYHDGTRLVAKLTDSNNNSIANATIYFTINSITYNRTTDANGTASIALNLESNTYSASITYNGSDVYSKISKNVNITVKPSIMAEDIVKMYQNDTQFYATFLGEHAKALANTNVTFNIHGVLYIRETDENGTTKLNINLNPGNYTLTAYNPVTGEEKGFNITVKSLIETKDLTKYYLNDSRFEAKVYDKDGLLAVNKTVTFNINGVFYTRTSDENGTVSLSINLIPGNYTITSMYEGLSIGNKVTVLSTLETSNLTMKYGDGSKFLAKTLDGQGNPLANQNITFNIHGVFYQKTTGDDGIASLNINLNKGEYIITSYWNDYQIGNKITVY